MTRSPKRTLRWLVFLPCGLFTLSPISRGVLSEEVLREPRMPSFRNTRRVRHSARHMFDLVVDVEAYPKFVPFCTRMRLRHRSKTGEGVETLVADMEVGYKAIRERFTSRAVCDR